MPVARTKRAVGVNPNSDERSFLQGAACGQATVATPPCRALLVATRKSASSLPEIL